MMAGPDPTSWARPMFPASLLAVVLAAPVPRHGAAEREYELLVVPRTEVPPTGGIGKRVFDTGRLVRVRFRDGKEVGREEIVAPTRWFFGEWGGHRVVAGRYVVARHAGVVDLADKKVAFDPGAAGNRRLIAGRTVFYDRPAFQDGLYSFDLDTAAAGKPARPQAWATLVNAPPEGLFSPDGRRWLDVVQVDPPPGGEDTRDRTYRLVVRSDGKAVPLGDGFRARFDRPRNHGQVPAAWLDDRTVVTQTANGKLVALDAATGRADKVVDIPITADPMPSAVVPGFYPRLSPQADGRLLYRCDRDYLVDVGKKAWAVAEWRPLGHGFEFEPAADVDWRVGYRVRAGGRPIGRVFFRDFLAARPENPSLLFLTNQYAAAPGHLAVVAPTADGSSRPRVWTAGAGEWVDLGFDAAAVIAWLPVRPAGGR